MSRARHISRIGMDNSVLQTRHLLLLFFLGGGGGGLARFFSGMYATIVCR